MQQPLVGPLPVDIYQQWAPEGGFIIGTIYVLLNVGRRYYQFSFISCQLGSLSMSYECKRLLVDAK
jgi:hypothetical protein